MASNKANKTFSVWINVGSKRNGSLWVLQVAGLTIDGAKAAIYDLRVQGVPDKDIELREVCVPQPATREFREANSFRHSDS